MSEAPEQIWAQRIKELEAQLSSQPLENAPKIIKRIKELEAKLDFAEHNKRIEELEAQLKWLPIETAPKTGEFFVIADFSNEELDGLNIEVCYYSPQKLINYTEVENGLYKKVETVLTEWCANNFHRATHWRGLKPLPTPPKGE